MAFGSTGQRSTRTIFGAAALARMRQEKADALLDTLLAYGVNHLDAAASYGDAELRLAPWLRRCPGRFFVATKTGERTAEGARESLHRSLDRLGVACIDLIQLHNLVDPEGWERALGPGGALEALVDARAQGLVRFIGVTGHGTQAPAMHLASLERFAFDSVLAPFNFTMLAQPEYAADFARLVATCRARGVAVQTIKSVARRRWRPGERRYSWYEPLQDKEALRRAVHWVLAQPGLFLNTSSDATLLEATLEAAAQVGPQPSDAAMQADVATFGMEPLFVRGVSDAI